MADDDEMSNYLRIYAQLIEMGFPDNISFKASKQCNNIEQAIEYCTNTGDTNNDNNTLNYHDDIATYDDIDEIKQPKYEHLCDANDIKNCSSTNRLIAMLKFYHINNVNYEEISKYVDKYKSDLSLIIITF